MPTFRSRKVRALCAGLALFAAGAPIGHAALAAEPSVSLTYADLADLADPAQLVLRVKVSRQAVVEPERAPGLAPGHVRLYVTAKPLEALAGTAPAAKAVHYLVDLPVGVDRKVPKLRGESVIVFARSVPGRPDELQLVAPDAQVRDDPQTVARLTPLLIELGSPGAPPRISGVRDILSVDGNLAGESETQLFLDSEDGPVLVSVVRRPNMAPVWSVSWSELVDQAGRPPTPETLPWYRLACSLPQSLPPGANLASDAGDRVRAVRDYALVRQELGACPRNRN
ncbi:hypothetical protein MB02_09810 [Croceicoccus estronivorus]|nr:hypothetical protein MB02_09810 [Croceicoccus estronivorus]